LKPGTLQNFPMINDHQESQDINNAEDQENLDNIIKLLESDKENLNASESNICMTLIFNS
ncbi:17354_t:CDS:2, partial [Gigaspora margarita]